METIHQLLTSKGHGPIHTVGSADTLFEAVNRMVDMKIGAVLVVDDNVIKGIITERDYLRFIAQEGNSARQTPVRELMTRKVIYVTPDASLETVMAIMTKARIRHVPVLSEGRLMGLVSIGDLVKQISDNREVHINTLEAYISDGYPGPDSPAAQEAEG